MSMTTPWEKHHTATVLIISTDVPAKALLQHHRKYNKWMAAGGHQEPDENSVEAAIRETLEETGIDISAAIPAARQYGEGVTIVHSPNYLLEESIPPHGDEPAHYHLDQVYVVRMREQPPQLSDRESHDIGWFTLAETEKLECFDDLHYILRQEMT